MSSRRQMNTRPQRRSEVKVPDAPKKEEIGPDIDPKTGKRDWSRYNASVVGARWNLSAPLHPAEAPGIAAARAAGQAAQAAYLATRKYYLYADLEKGWTHVGRKKRRAPTRQQLRIVEDEE